MYYSEDLIEEVRVKNDIVDVISGYVKLQKKGSSYFGLCPFHNEKSPSFSVSPSKQMYYCFGCGAGGNVFSFVRDYENYTFPETVKFLADRVGITLPEQEETEEGKRQRSIRSTILELNKLTAKFYYYQLRTQHGKVGLEYFQKRGLSDETMRSFGLGFAGKYSNELYQYLKKRGYSDEILIQSGLMNADEKHGMYDKFWNRVMFPIMDINGKVIGFGGRVMGEGKPKYLNSPETKVFDKSRNLYGLNVARTSRKKNLILCEGYMDVIALHQAGFTNAVASLGTSLTAGHAGLLHRYTDEVILTYDSDEAGVKAALRAIPILKEAGIRARVLHMQPYKDPDEFVKALGPESFQERMDQAENSFLFEMSVLQKKYQMDDPEQKTKFFREIAGRLAEFDSEVERENYIEAVAARYQVGFEGMRKLVINYALQGVSAPKPQIRSGKKNSEKEDGMQQSQRLLLTWCVDYPGIYQQIKTYISAEDFTNALYRQAAGLVFEQLEEGKLDPAAIVDQFAEEQQREIAQLFHARIPVENKQEVEKAVSETLRKVMQNSLEYQTKTMDLTDMQALQKLVAAKKKLQNAQKVHISID